METTPVTSLGVRINSYQLLDQLANEFNCATREGCAEIVLDTSCFDEPDEVERLQSLLPKKPIKDWLKYDYIFFYK